MLGSAHTPLRPMPSNVMLGWAWKIILFEFCTALFLSQLFSNCGYLCESHNLHKCAYLKILQPQLIVCWYKVVCSITKAFSRHFGESESEFISTNHTTLRFLDSFMTWLQGRRLVKPMKRILGKHPSCSMLPARGWATLTSMLKSSKCLMSAWN